MLSTIIKLSRPPNFPIIRDINKRVMNGWTLNFPMRRIKIKMIMINEIIININIYLILLKLLSNKLNKSFWLIVPVFRTFAYQPLLPIKNFMNWFILELPIYGKNLNFLQGSHLKVIWIIVFPTWYFWLGLIVE